ncbi:uncharacterized protein LOC143028344 [Oratosquilla oratoria]|uniref:uncharacterized protein LOC143028344 n=1 Tax=Oratosquilla oratoria TaxID=337810 RepID=UPI003F75B78E
MSGVRRVRLTELNPHLVCVLCGGYYVDATTIIECLHSFCKTCIVRYLESSKFCPICDVQVHKTKPLLSIRPDKILQDIVYKLVPGLYQNEMCLRREFYKKHADAKPLNREDSGCDSGHWYVLPDDTISVALKAASTIYLGNMKHKNSQPKNFVRYLQCPAGVSIGQLKKLLRAKFGLPANHPVSLLLGLNDHLQDSLTLVDVAYITSWQKTEPLLLFYQIYESASKRIKLDPELYKAMFEVKEEEPSIGKSEKVVSEGYKGEEEDHITPAIVTVGNTPIGPKEDVMTTAHSVVNTDDKDRTVNYLGNAAVNTDGVVLSPLCGQVGAVSMESQNVPAALSINNSSLDVAAPVTMGNTPIGIDNRSLVTPHTVGNAAVGIDGRGMPATLAVGNGTINMNGKLVPESPASCAAPGTIASPLMMPLAHGTRTPTFNTPTGNGVVGVGSAPYGEPQVAASNLTPLMMYGGSVGNTIGKAYSETKQGTTSDSLGKVNMLSSSSTEPGGETIGYSQIGSVLGCAGVTVAGAVQLFSQPMPGLTAMNSASCIMLGGPDSAAAQAVGDTKAKCGVSGSDGSGGRETSGEGSQVCTMPSLPPVMENVTAAPQNKETNSQTNSKDTSEWKEVQLTISECGVMSVCGGETTDFMESLISSPETSELLSKIESGVICDEDVPKDGNKGEGKDSCLPKELSMPKLEKETIGELPVSSNERLESDDSSKSCAPPTLAISATSTPVTLSISEKDNKKETKDSSKTKERESQVGGKVASLKKAVEGKQGGGGGGKAQTPVIGNTGGKPHGPSAGNSCGKPHGLAGGNVCGKSQGSFGGKGMQNSRESHQSHILAPLAAASQANLTKPFMKSGVTKVANSEEATRSKEVASTASCSRKNTRVDEGSKSQLHPPSKKSSQPIGYKTLKTPPKHWNPTISRQHLTPGGSKLLANKNDTPKTNKIFKARNTPQYSSSGSGSAVKTNYVGGGEKSGHVGNTDKGTTSGVQKLGVVQLDPRALGPVSIPITVHGTVSENACALPLTLAPALIVEPTTTTTTTTVAATALPGGAGGVRVQNSAAKESLPPNPASVSVANRVVCSEAQSVVTSAATGTVEAPSSYGKETGEMVPKVCVNNHRLSSNCVADAKCLPVQENNSSHTTMSSTSSNVSSSSTISNSMISSSNNSTNSNSTVSITTTSSTATISSQPSNTMPSKVTGNEGTSATSNCNNTHNKVTVTTVSSPLTSCGPCLSPSVPKLIPANTGVTSVAAQVSKVAVASTQPLASMLRFPVRSGPSTFGLGSSTGTASYPGASCTLSLPYYTTSSSLTYPYQYLYQEGDFNLLGHQPQSYMRAYSPCIPQSPLAQHEGVRCANLYSDPSSLQQGLIPMMNLISSPQSPKSHAAPSPRPHTPQSPRPHTPQSPRPHGPQSPRPPPPQSPKPPPPQSPKPHTSQSSRPHTSQSPRPHTSQSPRPHAPQSPRPHAPHSPRPHTPQSPRPHASQSPRPHAPQSPKPHTSQSPRPHASQSPRPHSSQSPRPHAPQSPKPQTPHSPSPHTVQLTRPITPQLPKSNCSQTPKSTFVPSSKLSSQHQQQQHHHQQQQQHHHHHQHQHQQQQLNKLPLSKSPLHTPHKPLTPTSPRPSAPTSSKSSHQQANKTPCTVGPKNSSHSMNKPPVAASPKAGVTLPPKSCSHSVNKTPSSVSKPISSQAMRAPVQQEMSKSGSTWKTPLNPQTTTNPSAPAFSVPHMTSPMASVNTTSSYGMSVGKDSHPDKKHDTTVETNKSGECKSKETTTASQQNTQATPPNSNSSSQPIGDGKAVSAANSQGSCPTGFSNVSQPGKSTGLIPPSLACMSDLDASQVHKYVTVSTGEQTPKNVPTSTQASADNNKSEFAPAGQSSKDNNTATVSSSPSDKVSSKWCPAQVRTNAASVSSRSSSMSTLAKSQCSGVEGSVGVPQSSACSPVCDVSHVIDAKTCAEPSVSTNNNQRPCLKS